MIGLNSLRLSDGISDGAAFVAVRYFFCKANGFGRNFLCVESIVGNLKEFCGGRKIEENFRSARK